MTRKTVLGALLGGATFIGGLLAGNGEKDWRMGGGTMDRNMVSDMEGNPAKSDLRTKEEIRGTATRGVEGQCKPGGARGVGGGAA